MIVSLIVDDYSPSHCNFGFLFGGLPNPHERAVFVLHVPVNPHECAIVLSANGNKAKTK